MVRHHSVLYPELNPILELPYLPQYKQKTNNKKLRRPQIIFHIHTLHLVFSRKILC